MDRATVASFDPARFDFSALTRTAQDKLLLANDFGVKRVWAEADQRTPKNCRRVTRSGYN